MRKQRQTDQIRKRSDQKLDRLSLHPLNVEDALRGAMATGRAPDQPKRRQERKDTKRRVKGEVSGNDK